MTQKGNLIRVITMACLLTLIASCASNTTLYRGQWARETDCSGDKQTWNKCLEKAKQDCPKGFKELGRDKRSHAGDTTGGMIAYLAVTAIDDAVTGRDNHRRLYYKCNQ